jgi:hypothetical protein
MSRLATRLLAVLAPAALLLPAAAHADQVSVDDAAGDAKAVNMAVALGGLLDGSTQDGPLLLDAPAETSTDVVRTTIDHARKRLTLTVQLRDLVDTDGHSAEFRIFTPEGRYALTTGVVDGQTVADLSPLGRSGSTVAVSEDGTVTVPEGPATKPCRTVRARYDVGTDTLTASAPTACLGSPKWVQVAVGMSRVRVTPQADGSANIASYVDDAFRPGVSFRSLGRSPKVRRG